jgi:uncharacterized protein (DUF58 family)
VNARAARGFWRWSQLVEIAERRLPALTRLKRVETLPILLNRHRIYVLPTRFGLLYSAVLIVMLLGALNYNNNPALLLTCLLGAASYQSVFQAFRALNQLELHTLRAEPCHAGDTMHIDCVFHTAARPRWGLRLRIGNDEHGFDLATGGDGSTRIELAAARRGWQRLGRMRLSSEYPFGLFHVWSWLNPEFAALVYPRLETNAPPLPHAGAAATARTVRLSGDELAALREYRPNDPPRNIAWKASAHHDTLLVREFELRRGHEIVLDYDALGGLEHEARIARLARWVCQAETAQQPYALHLPECRLGPALGVEHRHACLRELALLPGAAA